MNAMENRVHEVEKANLDVAVRDIEAETIVTVNTVDERKEAVELCRRIKTRRGEVVEFFRDTKSIAHQAWKAIVKQEKSFTDRLDAAEDKIKVAVLKFDHEQDAIRREMERKLQAEAEEKARRERERLEKKAERLKTPEKREAVLEQAAAVVAPVVSVAPVVEPTEGVSKRRTWKARVVDLDKVPRSFMVVNDKALQAYAKATKGAVPVAGVEFYEEESLAMSRL